MWGYTNSHLMREEHGLQNIIQAVDDGRDRDVQRLLHIGVEGAPKIAQHRPPVRAAGCGGRAHEQKFHQENLSPR